MISLAFSDHKQTDPLLKEILAASREAVVAEGTDGKILAANPRFLALAGWTGPGVGQPLDALVEAWAASTAHPQVLRGFFAACRTGHIPPAPQELQPNPGQVIEARFLTLAGGDGVGHRVWFFQEWRTSALAWVSHEIKNPLNAVLGFSELLAEALADEPSTQPVRTSLRGLRTSAKHLHSVLGDLLDLSRLESGVVEVRPEWVEVSAFLEELQDLFQARFHRRGIEFVLQGPEGPPTDLWTDPGRLSQVLGNLLSNALKYTKKGRVCLSVGRVGETWEFAVEDTGIGIPREQQAAIFEPFVQQQGQDVRQFGGTGLGLAICRTLTQSLGGRLALTSTPGEGSRFSVIFEHLSSRTQETRSDDPPLPTLPAISLLVADDERTNHLLIQGFLRGTPVTVLSAGDGREAVDVWERHRPPVVLMDLRMPGLTGVEAARRIRDLDPDRTCRMLAMSATRPLGREPLEDRGLWSGFLEKPFGKREFLNFLSNHITFVDDLSTSS